MPDHLKYINNLEMSQDKLSMDDTETISIRPGQSKFDHTIFDHLYNKYINNEKKRPVLWILSKMAGMEIN